MTLAEDLERFRRGAEVLATVLTGAAGEEVDYSPAPDKWTIRQIMAHLADAELVGAHRLRLVIAEDNPTLTSFDEKAWTRNLHYARRKPTQSLETFRRLRAENYELLRELPESVFERAGSHTENGPVSLRSLLQSYADHAESHARQLQAIRAEYKKVKGKK
jgi:hypothetical protein